MYPSHATALIDRASRVKTSAETTAETAKPGLISFLLANPVDCSPQSAVIRARAVARHASPAAPATEPPACCESRAFTGRLKLAFGVLFGRESTCECGGDAA